MARNVIRPAIVENFERQVIASGKEVIERWKPYLDAPGAPALTAESDRYALAVMLDVMNKQLPVMEATQTTSVFGTNYQKALLGMVRQVFPRLWGKEIASVQPMDRPTGQLFYLKTTRDDGSTLGVLPDEDASADQNYTDLMASRNYAADPGEGQDITKGMALSIGSKTVQVNTGKKLNVEATLETVQDLKAYHDLDAMEILKGAATDEITTEIDASLVYAFRQAAIANGTVTFGMQTPSGWTPDKWSKRIQRAILKGDSIIYRKSGRRPNVMVVGLEAFEELADLNTFSFDPDFSTDSGNYGLQPVGTLGTQYRVMMSRFVPENEILLGRKGNGFLDAGLVYAPYIALYVGDVWENPKNLKRQRSFAHRSLIETVSSTLFSRIVLDSGTAGIS